MCPFRPTHVSPCTTSRLHDTFPNPLLRGGSLTSIADMLSSSRLYAKVCSVDALPLMPSSLLHGVHEGNLK